MATSEALQVVEVVDAQRAVLMQRLLRHKVLSEAELSHLQGELNEAFEVPETDRLAAKRLVEQCNQQLQCLNLQIEGHLSAGLRAATQPSTSAASPSVNQEQNWLRQDH
eukprot:GHVT01022832.1.p1 GENE.GHVT01022832.1~~GHVT01022832.1.p1  ORF type:complete len:109 (+),score=19.16 GHVT01022832.1:118-444(+)